MSKNAGVINKGFEASGDTLKPVLTPAKASEKQLEANDGDDANERGNWGGQIEFILTCIGYAVGLGNVWRFPYLCYENGGGAFLIPYFLMLFLVGIPLFYMELSFGQFASLGPIAIWRINPMMKGLGYAMVIVNTFIGLYYNVIIAWSIYYFFASMTSVLPWTYCDNWWNTRWCLTNDFIQNNCSDVGETEIQCTDGRHMNKSDIQTPSEEYYYNQVLRLSDGIDNMGSIVWQLACCLLMSWAIVFFVLIKGISSLGKVVYFSSTFPYILLTIMLVRGLTLEGAELGIEYYLKPDFNKLTEAQVWSDAATQIFYSLSACTGGLIAMASYNKFDNNVLRDSLMVPIINCLTSFYSGFVIFSMLGFMATQKGVSVDEVADSGPGLVFVVYPEGLTEMPIAPMWAILFFFMLITLGFSSEFSMIECFFSAFIDELPDVIRTNRKINLTCRAVCIIIFYLITLPMVTEGGFYLFNLLDVMLGGFPLLFIGLFELIAISYIYGYDNFAEDIALMLGSRPGLIWKALWCFISPIIFVAVIIFMIVQYEAPTLFDDYEYPFWALGLGWGVVVFPLLFIPGVFLYRLFADGAWQIIIDGSKPLPEWGPALSNDRKGKYAVKDKANSLPDTFETSFTAIALSTNNGTKRASSVYSLPFHSEKATSSEIMRTSSVNELIKRSSDDKCDPATYL